MGGTSGSRVASTTKLVSYNGMSFAVSPAQERLLKAALSKGGAIFVKGAAVRTAKAMLFLGSLTDDGSFGPKAGSGNVDGERWMFKVNDGVSFDAGVGRADGAATELPTTCPVCKSTPRTNACDEEACEPKEAS